MTRDAPLPVKVIKDVMIPMRDGVSLAANLFIPETPGEYPGIFSYTPYLKDGYEGIAHEPHQRHFASRGYAVMQVDFRGIGSSEGTNPHPLDVQERLDGYDIVEWMAAQPWCTGNIGIWGTSYGGITALSIASTNPPHLRAIVPINATFDNYEWLLRTHGGRGLLLADVDWGTVMAASNLLPPTRQDSEGRWARVWAERLEANGPWFIDWHGKPNDPDYWIRRKIPYEQITVPIFGICGWYDAYTAPTFIVFEGVNAPKRVLIGPWKHALADLSPVWPVGGVYEMDRWWDRWLKEIENGVEDEPPVTIFILGDDEWRHETEWPISRTTTQRLYLSDERCLSAVPPTAAISDSYEYDSRVGTGSIGYNGHRRHLAVPADQTADDHLSLAYTGEPLKHDLEITGAPIAHIVVSATADELTLVAKLCVVAPDNSSRVIAQGNANPARVDAHAECKPMAADELREVEIVLHPTSIVIRAGDRLRLCLAGSDFPELWPTPYPYAMKIHRQHPDGSWLDLPVVPTRSEPLPAPQLQPPRDDLRPVGGADKLDPSESFEIVHTHLNSRTTGFETRRTWRDRIDGNTLLSGSQHSTVATNADQPWTTSLRTETRFDLRRPTATISVRVQSLMTPFDVKATAEIDVDGQPFFRKNWTKHLDDA